MVLDGESMMVREAGQEMVKEGSWERTSSTTNTKWREHIGSEARLYILKYHQWNSSSWKAPPPKGTTTTPKSTANQGQLLNYMSLLGTIFIQMTTEGLVWSCSSKVRKPWQQHPTGDTNTHCNSWGYVAWWNILTTGKLGREGLVLLTLQFHCLLLKEVRARTQTGKELRGKNWCRSRGAVLFWFAPHGSACFFYRTQDHQPKGGSSHSLPGPPILISNWQRFSTGLPCSLSLGKYFLNWSFFLSDISSLYVKLTQD